MAAKTEETRIAWRTAFCSGCVDYVETYLTDDAEECEHCGDDCTIFDSEGEYTEAARADHEEDMWQAEREEW